MSSRQIIIESVVYVRSRDAAREVGLCRDYTSALARSGLIAGHRVAGSWFVNLASLRAFIADQERQKEIWRARLADMRRAEQRLAGHPAAFA
jgi:hypothetical protein